MGGARPQAAQFIERVETIAYTPGVATTGDLEPATRIITRTTEGTVADYSATLTLPAPTDPRLEVRRIAARLAVTIDSIPAGDINLRCRVYVASQTNMLFDLTWTAAGAQLTAVDTHAGALAPIFDLLRAGVPRTFLFFFWRTGTGTGPVISLVQLWLGVGTCLTHSVPIAQLLHTGLLSFEIGPGRIGTGTPAIWSIPFGWDRSIGDWSPNFVLLEHITFFLFGTVDADLNVASRIIANLRSEQ